MRQRIEFLDKMLLWLMTVVLILPNFFQTFTSITALASEIEPLIDSVLYEGPDGSATVQAKLTDDGKKIEWVVHLSKQPSQAATTQRLEVDVGSGGLSQPHTIHTDSRVETIEGILQLEKESFTLEAATQQITFVTDILDSTLPEVSLKMAAAIVTEENASPLIIHTSPQTKTFTIPLPKIEIPPLIEDLPVEEESTPIETPIEEPEETVIETPAPVETSPTEEANDEAISTPETDEIESAEPTTEEPTPPLEEPTSEEIAAPLEEPEKAEVIMEEEKTEQDPIIVTENPENPVASVETQAFPWSPVPTYQVVVPPNNPMALRTTTPTPAYTNNPINGIYPLTYTQSDYNIRNYNPQLWEYKEAYLTKYATKTSIPGQYDINLKVQGKSIESTQTIDIVIVYDNSNSMGDSGRFTSAKNATKTFIDGLLNATTNSGNQIRMALVTFGEKLIDEYSHYSFTTNGESLKNKLPTYANGGGTNTQSGLSKAADIMSTSTAQTKVIVVISDGVPTYSSKATQSIDNTPTDGIVNYGISAPTKRGTTFSNIILGDGTTFDLYEGFLGLGKKTYSIDGYEVLNHGWATMSQAVLMKNAGLVIYGLGIQINAGAGATQQEALNVMKNIASPGKFYNAAQVNEISQLLANISSQISKTITNGSVEDPMGNMILLDKGSDNEFLPEDYKLTGSSGLKLSDLIISADENEQITINNLKLGEDEWINLKYTIHIKTEDPNFQPEFYYQTNGITTLTPTSTTPTQKLNFPIPSIKAPGVSVSGLKTWVDDTPEDRPEVISLQLQRKIPTTNYQDIPEKTVQLQAQIKQAQSYTFNQLPAFNNFGKYYTYTVKEIDIPAGYVLTTSGYNLRNTLKKGSLIIEKRDEKGITIKGTDPTLQATFQLKQGETVVQTLMTDEAGRVTFSGLKVGTYTLTETDSPDGYTKDPAVYAVEVSLSGSKISVVVKDSKNKILPSNPLVIRNTNNQQLIEATKKWVDGPTEKPTIFIQLYADGEPVGVPQTVITPIGQHQVTVKWDKQLVKNETGKEIIYTVDEVDEEGTPITVPGYEKKVTGMTITNTYLTPKVHLDGMKKWEDPFETFRPTSIVLRLYRKLSGEEKEQLIQTLNVTAGTNGKWMYNFGEQDATDRSGTFYQYRVEEAAVPNYAADYNLETLQLTNRLLTGNVFIRKVDFFGQNIQEPVTFKLTRLTQSEGAFVAYAEEMDTQNGEIQFKDLVMGTYQLEEVRAPEGYNLMDKPITIVVKKIKEKIVVSTEDGTFITQEQPLVVKNISKSVLPETGGMGTTLFSVIGLGLMIGAGMFFKKSTNKAEKGESKDE
ncbi:Cna B-type domain-containing protein [Jeotgalibaca caeni]|uniref:Cna B-type domain-containing protein n=1 Tax=Jeotgalibaca caeni TaxID=3028623 RepID=UPI00237E9115|nr:Cna B-type domain-containing protein [Jeotgalibaca caeni]MDE1549519.1 Cna B-type domain-containing protein [Jeotgalibaca caeni]